MRIRAARRRRLVMLVAFTSLVALNPVPAGACDSLLGITSSARAGRGERPILLIGIPLDIPAGEQWSGGELDRAIGLDPAWLWMRRHTGVSFSHAKCHFLLFRIYGDAIPAGAFLGVTSLMNSNYCIRRSVTGFVVLAWVRPPRAGAMRDARVRAVWDGYYQEIAERRVLRMGEGCPVYAEGVSVSAAAVLLSIHFSLIHSGVLE